MVNHLIVYKKCNGNIECKMWTVGVLTRLSKSTTMDWFCKLSSRRSTTPVIILMVVLRAEGSRDGWPSSTDVATTSSAVTCVMSSNCSWSVRFSLLSTSLAYRPEHITEINTYLKYNHKNVQTFHSLIKSSDL